MTVKVGSIFPTAPAKDVWEQIERDVVTRVNLLMAAFHQSKGAKGIDPTLNYNIRYDGAKGRVYVDLWHGDKKYAWLGNKVQSYDVSDFMGSGEITLKVQRKEVII